MPYTDCPEEHIGEPGRSCGDILRKHPIAPSPIHQHSQTTEQQVDLECLLRWTGRHRVLPGL